MQSDVFSSLFVSINEVYELQVALKKSTRNILLVKYRLM
jgi:hypothetical protein